MINKIRFGFRIGPWKVRVTYRQSHSAFQRRWDGGEAEYIERKKNDVKILDKSMGGFWLNVTTSPYLSDYEKIFLEFFSIKFVDNTE